MQTGQTTMSLLAESADAKQRRLAIGAFDGEKGVKRLHGDTAPSANDVMSSAMRGVEALQAAAPGHSSFSDSRFSGASTVLRLACMSLASGSI